MDVAVKHQRGMLNRPILIAIPIIIGLFLSKSPLFMMANTVSGERPWADKPVPLVATPQYETKKTDIFTVGATHMALLHNSILRGYNSIWQQAPNVKPADKNDFVGYCLAWHKFVVSHHDDEEANLFPQIEELLDDKTVFEETHKEHGQFLGGLGEFRTYLSSLKAPSDFSGAELQKIMSGFQDSFANHFSGSEVHTIAALADHPKAPKSGSPEEEKATAFFKSWGKTTVTKAGMLDVVPFFLLNLDGTVEDGMWANWPPMPGPIRWGMENIAGTWHAGWWKFSSCKGGQPRELYAV